MDAITLPANKSLTLSDKIPNGNIHKNNIIVGCSNKFEYHSLLYFDISSLPHDITICSAKLTLFKCDGFYDDTSSEFIIYPICSHFSIYTTYLRIPSANTCSGIKFYPMTSKSTVDVNITSIVSSWIENCSSNKGIIISDMWNNCMASFGSSLAKKQEMVPFITITYTHNNTSITENSRSNCNHNFGLAVQIINTCNNCSPCIPSIPSNPSIIEVIATGKIEKYSVFVVIIEVIITRTTGNINKYYVSDEYKNPTDTAMSINKTYSIPIVPALAVGDSITSANIYGAYKDSNDIIYRN